MAVATQLNGPPLNSGSTPVSPVVIDSTGLTTTVPLLVKNGRSQSGVVAQVTGTVATGFVLNDSAGTARGVFGYAVSANDWLTGSAAGDVVLLGDSAKVLRIGAIGGANNAAAFDLVNKRLGIGITAAAAPSYSLHITGTDTAGGRLEIVQATASSQAMWELATGSCAVSAKANGTTTAGSSLGVTHAGAVTFVADPTAVGLIFGTNSAFDIIVGTNGSEKGRVKSSGDWVIGSGNTAATVLATTATAGFLRLPTCAGAPTGAAVDGSIVIDTSTATGKIWVRVAGAWVGILVA